MALIDAEFALDLLTGRLLNSGYIKQRDTHNSYSRACAVNSTTYYCYYYGWQSYSAVAALIGTDDNGFVYYELTGSTIQAYYESVTTACYNGPSDGDSPAIVGTASQQFTVTLNQNGSPEQRPLDSAAYAQYTGYPVVACLTIQGSDYPVVAGIASAVTVAAAQSACGLANKTVDMTIKIT